MGRAINWQMAKSGSKPTTLIPELKFLTPNQVGLPSSCFSPLMKDKWMRTRRVPVGLGSSPSSCLPDSPLSLSTVTPLTQVTNAQDQSCLLERATGHFFFLSSSSAKGWFQKGSVKTIVQKKRIFPSSSRVRPSKGVGGWRMEDPGESSEIKSRVIQD